MSDDLVKRLLAVTDDATVNPDGPEAAARIVELEAALRYVLPYVDTCNSWHREAQKNGYAALEGKGNE